MNGDNKLKVIVAAGGSGGHIFPALHIANALKSLPSGADVAFVGSGRPLEQKLIDGNGYQRFVLPAVPVMQRGIIGVIKFVLTFPFILLQNIKLLRKFGADVVIGVGGYVSVMPVIAARLLGIPTWIHEAELQPGLANRGLAYFADKISVAFPDAEMPCRKKVVYTGHPVRPDLADIADMTISDESPKNILIVGGSQGARSIDMALSAMAPWLKERKLNIKHQTRAENLEVVTAAYQSSGVNAEVVQFINDMPQAFKWSDIVISRSGAGAVMELEVVNRPSILVPYSFAQGGHQTANARFLEKRGKAIVLDDNSKLQENIKASLERLLDPVNYKKIRSERLETRSLSAAKTIAEGVFKLVRE